MTHFVGATSQSSSSYYLVKRLNDELDASGITFPARPVPEGLTKEEPKLDFQSLCQRLWDRLGDYAGEKRIVILLDALNQLDDGHELGWLPYRLGPSVRVVVSCIDDAAAEENSREKKVLTALDSRHPKPTRTLLGPLSVNDVRTIVTRYLKEYCKELDVLHVDAICDEKKLPQARNPSTSSSCSPSCAPSVATTLTITCPPSSRTWHGGIPIPSASSTGCLSVWSRPKAWASKLSAHGAFTSPLAALACQAANSPTPRPQPRPRLRRHRQRIERASVATFSAVVSNSISSTVSFDRR